MPQKYFLDDRGFNGCRMTKNRLFCRQFPLIKRYPHLVGLMPFILMDTERVYYTHVQTLNIQTTVKQPLEPLFYRFKNV